MKDLLGCCTVSSWKEKYSLYLPINILMNSHKNSLKWCTSSPPGPTVAVQWWPHTLKDIPLYYAKDQCETSFCSLSQKCKSIPRHMCEHVHTHSHFIWPPIALVAYLLSSERKMNSGQTQSACLPAERCISTLSVFFFFQYHLCGLYLFPLIF